MHRQDFALPPCSAVATIRIMNIGSRLLWYVAVASVCGAIPASYRHLPGVLETAPAPVLLPAPQQSTSELEVSLFVQDPHLKGGKRGIEVVWIPQPILKYCLGKTTQECSTIDYCIRTTNKQAAMCKNLAVDTARLPAYPADPPPRRVLSLTCLYPMTATTGCGSLMKFFESAPKGSLDHLSTRARIKARVKLTRTADDDQFELLEVLATPLS
jgi:hypothetical protein